MMKIPLNHFRFAVVGAVLCAGISRVLGQSFSMQIVADNDFAVFGGTSNSVTSLIYQNDFGWPDQLNNLSTLTFNLQPGETTFFLLGMGGGGNENISGTVNGVDLTTINVAMSSDLSGNLTGYDPGTVADGSYDASLSDVQAIFPFLTFGGITPTTGDDTVADQSPTGHGFHFDPNTAHLFSFDASDVGVAPLPEPSTFDLLLAGAGVLIAARRFRRASRAGG
jgi:hypothetical protein